MKREWLLPAAGIERKTRIPMWPPKSEFLPWPEGLARRRELYALFPVVHLLVTEQILDQQHMVGGRVRRDERDSDCLLDPRSDPKVNLVERASGLSKCPYASWCLCFPGQVQKRHQTTLMRPISGSVKTKRQ